MSVEFWGHPETWPADTPEWVFLARAVRDIGRAQYPDWSDLAPGLSPATRQLPAPLSGAAEAAQLEALLNWSAEAPGAPPSALDRRQRWQAQQVFWLLRGEAADGRLATIAVQADGIGERPILPTFWAAVDADDLLSGCRVNGDPAVWVFVNRLQLASLLYPEGMAAMDAAIRGAEEYVAIERDRAEAEAEDEARADGGAASVTLTPLKKRRKNVPPDETLLALIAEATERRRAQGIGGYATQEDVRRIVIERGFSRDDDQIKRLVGSTKGNKSGPQGPYSRTNPTIESRSE